MKLTPDAERAVAAIVAAGGRPLFVGGCVRDWLLGVESKDIDIEVHGPVSVDTVEAALARVGRVDSVGKSFGVLKFGQDVDVSFPRRDSKVAEGHTGFAIEFDSDMTVEEALSRRDFTINSMAQDAVTEEIIDPFSGQADLELGILRHTSDAFADDPLRVLRAVQFAGRFKMTLAPETAELCRSIVDRFPELSIERVWMEWWKILTKGQSMAHVHDALVHTGLIKFFPEFRHDMTAFTDRVIDKIWALSDPYRRSAIILGSLFADKPSTIRTFLKRIDAPRWLSDTAPSLAQVEITTERLETRAKVRVMSRALRGVRLRDWFIVHWFVPGSPMWEAAAEEGVLDQARPRLLTGEHLISRGWEPGPLFKVILDTSIVKQDREGWQTEAEALAWLDSNWILVKEENLL